MNKRGVVRVAVAVVLTVACVAPAADQNGEVGTLTLTDAPAAEEFDPEATVVTIGETVISEGDLRSEIDSFVDRMSQGNPIPPERMAQIRQQVRKQVLETMIMEEVIKKGAAKREVAVSEADVQGKIDEVVEQIKSQRGWDDEELANQLQQAGLTLEKWTGQMRQSPQMKSEILLEKMATRAHGDELNVTDEDVQKYYDDNRATQFTQEEEVRASHILIDTRQATDDEAKAAAKAKAEEVLALVQDGGDFAALAKEHSACPSSQKGGDLGFFAKGRMVPEFSDAAFAMQPGDVSGIVETQFGYHIIKVTDRREPEVKEFDEVKDSIRDQLEAQQRQNVMRETLGELRKEVTVSYANKSDETGPAPGPMGPPRQ